MSLRSALTGSAHAFLARPPLCVVHNRLLCHPTLGFVCEMGLCARFLRIFVCKPRKPRTPDLPTWTRTKISIFDTRFYRLSMSPKSLPVVARKARSVSLSVTSVTFVAALLVFRFHLLCLRCSTSIKPLWSPSPGRFLPEIVFSANCFFSFQMLLGFLASLKFRDRTRYWRRIIFWSCSDGNDWDTAKTYVFNI